MGAEIEPLLFDYLIFRDDRCHGSVPPLLVREWYEPIGDEL